MNDKLAFKCKAASTERLDRFLHKELSALPKYSHISRSQVKNWIEAGQVTVAGSIVRKAGFELRPDQVVTAAIPEPETGEFEPYDFALDVIYEDQDLLVVNKPVGLSMHPGAGNKSKTLLNALVGKLQPKGFEKSARPGIVHRLDKDTCGLVVVARNPASQSVLSAQFAAHTVERRYKALVLCLPRSKSAIRREKSGHVSTQIGRHPKKRILMAVLPKGGRVATTNWKVLRRLNYGALVELKLETGRTHQIRVHMSHIGAPVIGDPAYGNFTALPAELRLAAKKFGHQALCAYKLGFDHPRTGERMNFEADLPQDFNRLIEIFSAYGQE